MVIVNKMSVLTRNLKISYSYFIKVQIQPVAIKKLAHTKEISLNIHTKMEKDCTIYGEFIAFFIYCLGMIQSTTKQKIIFAIKQRLSSNQPAMILFLRKYCLQAVNLVTTLSLMLCPKLLFRIRRRVD